MIRTIAGVITLAILLVVQPNAQGTQANTPTRATPAVAPLINLNTATAAELEKLPGVGARMAERIVAHREKNGPFKKIEELMNVQGIGEKSFLNLRAQITVTQAVDAAAR
jgi:competence protein ComEA